MKANRYSVKQEIADDLALALRWEDFKAWAEQDGADTVLVTDANRLAVNLTFGSAGWQDH